MWADKEHVSRLHIDIDLFREVERPQKVLVTWSLDYNWRAEHRETVLCAELVDCVKLIVSRLIEGSVFNDASSPGTTAPVPVTAGEGQGQRLQG